MAIILALDMSSTCIGWVLRADQVLAYGAFDLPKSDIAQRCLAAQEMIERLIADRSIDAVAIESPVARFAKAVIPQARVSGAVLATLAARGLAWVEVTPSEGKMVLCEDGAATKREMVEAAAQHFGYDVLHAAQRKGKWHGVSPMGAVYSEDTADALGIALAAVGKVRIG